MDENEALFFASLHQVLPLLQASSSASKFPRESEKSFYVQWFKSSRQYQNLLSALNKGLCSKKESDQLWSLADILLACNQYNIQPLKDFLLSKENVNLYDFYRDSINDLEVLNKDYIQYVNNRLSNSFTLASQCSYSAQDVFIEEDPLDSSKDGIVPSSNTANPEEPVSRSLTSGWRHWLGLASSSSSNTSATSSPEDPDKAALNGLMRKGL